MKRVLLSLVVCHVLFLGSAGAQIRQWGISLDVDALSLGGTVNYQLNRWIGPGVSLRKGDARGLSFSQEGFAFTRDWSMYAVFNRSLLSRRLTLDIGFRTGDAAIVDGSLKHGFSHLDYSGLYLQPMWGWRMLKVGTTFTFSTNRRYGMVWSPLLLRGIVYF